MTKKKLNLDELRVKSFVTSKDAINEETLKGGGGVIYSCIPYCGGGSPFCAYTQHTCYDINCDGRTIQLP